MERSHKPSYLPPSSQVWQMSLILYCPVTFMKDVLFMHQADIRCYAFAYHDQDLKPAKDESGKPLLDDDGKPVMIPKEPHIHLLLIFNRRIRASVMYRWFFRIDDNGKKESVLFEKILDRLAAYEYLIHKYDPDQYQYPESRRKCSCVEDFISDYEAPDLLTACMDELMQNKNPRYLYQKYGSQFLIHMEKLYAARDRILAWEARNPDFRKRYNDPLDELLEDWKK